MTMAGLMTWTSLLVLVTWSVMTSGFSEVKDLDKNRIRCNEWRTGPPVHKQFYNQTSKTYSLSVESVCSHDNGKLPEYVAGVSVCLFVNGLEFCHQADRSCRVDFGKIPFHNCLEAIHEASIRIQAECAYCPWVNCHPEATVVVLSQDICAHDPVPTAAITTEREAEGKSTLLGTLIVIMACVIGVIIVIVVWKQAKHCKIKSVKKLFKICTNQASQKDYLTNSQGTFSFSEKEPKFPIDLASTTLVTHISGPSQSLDALDANTGRSISHFSEMEFVNHTKSLSDFDVSKTSTRRDWYYNMPIPRDIGRFHVQTVGEIQEPQLEFDNRSCITVHTTSA